MASSEVTRDARVRWLAAIVSLLPFALLFIAFAAGVAIQLWLFLIVLAWCLLMPAWMQRRRTAADETEDTQPHPTPEARGIEPRSEQLNTLHRLVASTPQP